MKVAIVHDWLVARGGAEKVLEQIVECYPDADLFSLVDFLEDRRPLGDKPVTTSFIQRLPFARASSPRISVVHAVGERAVRSVGYDLIITSSQRSREGVIVGPDQIHVSFRTFVDALPRGTVSISICAKRS